MKISRIQLRRLISEAFDSDLQDQKKDNDVLIESIEKLTEEMSDKLLESIKQKKEIEALKEKIAEIPDLLEAERYEERACNERDWADKEEEEVDEVIDLKCEIGALKKKIIRKGRYHGCLDDFVDPRCKMERPDRAFIIEWTNDNYSGMDGNSRGVLRDELLEDFGIDSSDDDEEDKN